MTTPSRPSEGAGATPTYAHHEFKQGGYLAEPAPDDRCVWRVDGHSPYCDINRIEHDAILAQRRAGTWRWPWTRERLKAGRLDPDPLIDAIKYADAAGVFDGDRVYADIAATLRRRYPALRAALDPQEAER